MGTLLCLAGVVLRLAAIPSPALAGTCSAGSPYTWNGGGGSWSVAGNWTPHHVPGSSGDDCAVIGGGSVDLSSALAHSLLDLTLKGSATLTGSGTVEIAGTFDWLGGSMTGTGITRVLSGGMVQMYAPGSTLTFDDSRVLDNMGTALWLAGHLQAAAATPVFMNAGTFDIRSDATFDAVGVDGSDPQQMVIDNTGTITKTVATGVTRLYTGVHNDGMIDVASGTVRLLAGGGSGAPAVGSFEAGAGAHLDLGGGVISTDCAYCRPYALGPGAELKGGVSIGISDTDGIGDDDTGAAELTVASGANVSFTGTNDLLSSVIDGSGDITIDGTLHWTNDFGVSAIRGTGVATVNGQLDINGDPGGVHLGENQALDNFGTVTITSLGYVAADDGSMFHNEVGGTVDFQNDVGYFEGFLGGLLDVFINDGLVEKTAGSGTAVIGADFSGSGSISVTSGSLIVSGNEVKGDLATGSQLSTGTTDQSLSGPHGESVNPEDFASTVTAVGGPLSAVSVKESSDLTVPSGYAALGYGSRVSSVSAGTQTAIALHVDKAKKAKNTPQSLKVFDAGVLVPNCPMTGTIPDPCVSARAPGTGGDLVVTVRSSALGTVSASGPGAPQHRGCCVLVIGALTSRLVTITNSFTPQDALQGLAGEVKWTNSAATPRHITDASGLGLFDSGDVPPGGSYSHRFQAAGRYAVADPGHPSLIGTISVPVELISTLEGPAVGWAAGPVPACTSCVFDVQFGVRKQSGTWSPWTSWQTGTSDTTAVFTQGVSGKTYRFQARVRKSGTTVSSGWSPFRKITV